MRHVSDAITLQRKSTNLASDGNRRDRLQRRPLGYEGDREHAESDELGVPQQSRGRPAIPRARDR